MKPDVRISVNSISGRIAESRGQFESRPARESDLWARFASRKNMGAAAPSDRRKRMNPFPVSAAGGQLLNPRTRGVRPLPVESCRHVRRWVAPTAEQLLPPTARAVQVMLAVRGGAATMPRMAITTSNLISLYQNNRNPFVDHPEWVDLVFSPPCTNPPVLNIALLANGVALSWPATNQTTQLEYATNSPLPSFAVTNTPALANAHFTVLWTNREAGSGDGELQIASCGVGRSESRQTPGRPGLAKKKEPEWPGSCLV